MGRQGLITPEEAEQVIWSFYWQLDNSRDRRGATPIPTDEEINDRQRQVQEKRQGLLVRAAKHVVKWFSPAKQRDAYEGAMQDAMDEWSHFTAGQPGKIDTKTGLPQSEAELSSGRGVKRGRILCLGAIISPSSLAETCTLDLEPCPPGENAERWGSELSHWRAMMYKPKAEWTEENARVVDHNTFQIQRKFRDLMSKGFFKLPEFNPSDAEMHDLVWTDEADLPIAVKITWEGYEEMQRVCRNNPELQRHLHLLEVAGREVRETAPEWVKQAHDRGGKEGITVETGGAFDVDAGPGIQVE
jgi:hypothetical protein